jgi:peroxiredoxin
MAMWRALVKHISRLWGRRSMPRLTAGTTAPPFALASTEGKRYSLPEGLAGGPVLATFFKVNCPTCQYTLPFVERLYRQFRAQGVQVWGFSQDETHASRQFAREYGLTFPILIDDHPYKVSRAYRLEFVPTIFLTAPDGRITVASEGFCKADFLEIQKSLAQSHSAVPGALFLPAENVPEYKPG